MPTDSSVKKFIKTIRDYYRAHGRDFPWRRTQDPYQIMVSEIMLQQTQTERVINYFNNWLVKFPTVYDLARAPLAEVLKAWQGLGYNRRAMALKRSAELIATQYGGRVPDTLDELVTLPGIGPATASAILAFAFNKPSVFIETNIRSVYIHFFFKDRDKVTDKELLPLIEKTVDRRNPRIWYYALMDYGVKLKKEQPNPSRKSRHYTKQSPFKDSDRRIRGLILKTLLSRPNLTQVQLTTELGEDLIRIKKILQQLVAEEFIICQKRRYRIT